MRRYDFHRVSSLQELLALKAELGARGLPIAGGTDLLVALRKESCSLPSVRLIDISRVPELQRIAIDDHPPDTGISSDEAGSSDKASSGDEAGSSDEAGNTRRSCGDSHPWVRIGALVTHSQIEKSTELHKRALLLCEASAEIGSPQIRNRGTIGGNICNASACADTIPPLIALGAQLAIHSVRGKRHLPLEDAIPAPYETVLADDEILTEISFPSLPIGVGSAFVKLGRRKALSISRMSIAVALERDHSGNLRRVRIAAGSVTPTARRFPSIENLLSGKAPSAAHFASAGKALAAEMIRISGRRWSTPFKEPVVAALLRRALAKATGNELLKDLAER